MAIEIVSFPINSMVMFHSYLYVYQRVTKRTWSQLVRSPKQKKLHRAMFETCQKKILQVEIVAKCIPCGFLRKLRNNIFDYTRTLKNSCLLNISLSFPLAWLQNEWTESPATLIGPNLKRHTRHSLCIRTCIKTKYWCRHGTHTILGHRGP